MLGKIIVTSPQKENTQLVKDIGNQLNCEINIIESALEDAVSLVKSMLSSDPHQIWVIISRGATFRLLCRDIRSVPIMSMNPTEFDMIIALDKARHLGNRIGILATDRKQIEIFQRVSIMLRLPVKAYFYTNWQDFYIQVEKSRREDMDVLIGGGETGAMLTKERGIKHIPLLANEGTVKQALKRAIDIIEITKREKENSELIKAIVEYSHEGIMAIDENAIVSVANPIATKFFDLNESDIIGHPLADLSYRRSLVEMFEESEERLGYIHKTKDAVLLVNKVPISYSNQHKGLMVTFKDVTKIQEEESKIRHEIYTKGLVAKFKFSDIVYKSSIMSNTLTKAKKFTNTDYTVLIYGESGTGKELIAQSMHSGHRKRQNKPFVAINCASLDDNLLKSELFGYEEGAFTGARKGGKPGLFELAHGGTIFLDEIGKISLELQANLLRVLQEKEVRRIGSNRVTPIEVRIIAASNEKLEHLINNGSFREDLYFRLNVLKLILPPLRERREDIPLLIYSMFSKYSKKNNKQIISLPAIVLKRLARLEWPGNIRQLEHLIERCVVLSENEEEAAVIMMELIDEEFGSDLKSRIDQLPSNNHTHDQITVKIGSLNQMVTEIIKKVSAQTKLSKSELALRLGISRTTLWKIVNKNN